VGKETRSGSAHEKKVALLVHNFDHVLGTGGQSIGMWASWWCMLEVGQHNIILQLLGFLFTLIF